MRIARPTRPASDPGMVIVKIGRFDVNSAGEAETLCAKANSGDEADLTLIVTRGAAAGGPSNPSRSCRCGRAKVEADRN